jgi:hypothetical protein
MEKVMDLQAASVWLERSHVGFSEIHQFAELCRTAALNGVRDSAALILLAERAAAFTDRHEGIAVSNDVVTDFLEEIRTETAALRDASAQSDERFVQALNVFASRLASNVFV